MKVIDVILADAVIAIGCAGEKPPTPEHPLTAANQVHIIWPVRYAGGGVLTCPSNALYYMPGAVSFVRVFNVRVECILQTEFAIHVIEGTEIPSMRFDVLFGKDAE